MARIEIILGERWATDRAVVEKLRARAKGQGAFDFAHVLDVVDIFVDGANVGAAASADAIACLTRDLLAALARLGSGEERKVAVPFYESSFELVFQRVAEPGRGGGERSSGRAAERPGGRGASGRAVERSSGRGAEPRVLITFFRGGPSPEILLRNHEVSLRELSRAAAGAARRLASQIVRVNRALAEDAFVRDLRQLAERVHAGGERLSPIVEPERETRESRTWRRLPARLGPQLAFRGDATWSDLLGPALPDRADLSALLWRGELAVWDGGRRRAVDRVHLFLVAERLLAVVRHVLEARDNGRVPAPLRLQCDGLLIGVRPDEGDGLVLSFAHRADDRDPVAVRFPDGETLAGAALLFGADLRRAMLEAGPGQRRNLRLQAFAAEMRQLGSWRADLVSKAVVNRDPGTYRVEPFGDADEPEAGAAPALLVGEPRRMRYLERWHLEASGLDLGATWLCGDRLLVTTGDALLAVDRDSGEMLWRLPESAPPVAVASIMVGNRGVARVAPGGRVGMLELSTGSELWSTRVRPTVGRPTGTTLGSARAPRLIVVAEGSAAQRGLVALDALTGEARWRFAARRATEDAAFEFQRAGRILVVVCGDSAIYGLDADTGATVWRYADRVRFVLRPRLARDMVVAVAGQPGRPGATLYALDAFSGRLVWKRPLTGAPLAGPTVSQTVAVVATADPSGVGRPGLTAVETTTGTPLWRRTVPGLERGFSALPVDERIVVNIAGGVAMAFEGPSGDEAWVHRTSGDPADIPERLEPILRGSALFLPMDAVQVLRPDDGEVIHRLGEGLVPDWLRVDERGHLFLGEQSGHLAAYGIAARLAVVK
ncbi:MAG: PQQ-binding-like beta-propeller repeat protein [Deltaproteobacteria bacterium]|nr:PQQ-binding-like beta-propeller repeat protein [Deltaproteobacteria bacterium]